MWLLVLLTVKSLFQVSDKYYTIMDMAFSTKAVFNHGLDDFVNAMVTNRAGKVSFHLFLLLSLKHHNL